MRKQEKKLGVVSLVMMKKNRLEKMTKKKKRKMNKRLQTLVKRNSIFNNVKCVSWLIH